MLCCRLVYTWFFCNITLYSRSLCALVNVLQSSTIWFPYYWALRNYMCLIAIMLSILELRYHGVQLKIMELYHVIGIHKLCNWQVLNGEERTPYSNLNTSFCLIEVIQVQFHFFIGVSRCLLPLVSVWASFESGHLLRIQSNGVDKQSPPECQTHTLFF